MKKSQETQNPVSFYQNGWSTEKLFYYLIVGIWNTCCSSYVILWRLWKGTHSKRKKSSYLIFRGKSFFFHFHPLVRVLFFNLANLSVYGWIGSNNYEIILLHSVSCESERKMKVYLNKSKTCSHMFETCIRRCS